MSQSHSLNLRDRIVTPIHMKKDRFEVYVFTKKIRRLQIWVTEDVLVFSIQFFCLKSLLPNFTGCIRLSSGVKLIKMT